MRVPDVDTKLTERSTRVSGAHGNPAPPEWKVNPFGANTPAVQALADATQFRGDAWKTKTSIDSLSATVRKRPDPSCRVANGACRGNGRPQRRDSFSIPRRDPVRGHFRVWRAISSVDKSRFVAAGYAELVAPVVRGLELTGRCANDH